MVDTDEDYNYFVLTDKLEENYYGYPLCYRNIPFDDVDELLKQHFDTVSKYKYRTQVGSESLYSIIKILFREIYLIRSNLKRQNISGKQDKTLSELESNLVPLLGFCR